MEGPGAGEGRGGEGGERMWTTVEPDSPDTVKSSWFEYLRVVSKGGTYRDRFKCEIRCWAGL